MQMLDDTSRLASDGFPAIDGMTTAHLSESQGGAHAAPQLRAFFSSRCGVAEPLEDHAEADEQALRERGYGAARARTPSRIRSEI